MDHFTINSFRHKVDELIAWYEPEILQLDYSAVSFMDSAGIGFILGRIKKIYEIDGKIRIVNATDRIKKVLELACVNKYATIM